MQGQEEYDYVKFDKDTFCAPSMYIYQVAKVGLPLPSQTALAFMANVPI